MTTNVPTRTVEVKRSSGPNPFTTIPGLGNIVNTNAILGRSSENELNITLTGLQLSTPDPATILLQLRQGDNRDMQLPDIFAVQVIKTDTASIQVCVRRLDNGGGWEQNLRLDILIFDQIHNP